MFIMDFPTIDLIFLASFDPNQLRNHINKKPYLHINNQTDSNTNHEISDFIAPYFH